MLYALCVVAPSMALAFADGSVAAHCLAANHHSLSQPQRLHSQHHTHIHSAATADHSEAAAPVTQDESKHGDYVGACCGLFCFAVALNGQEDIASQRISHKVVVLALDERLTGRGPDRIIRPPKAL